LFERFTDRGRRVVVLAQEEARLLNHNYIGTEHLLLGLLHEGQGIAAKALDALGISLERVRQKLEEIIGQGDSPPSGNIPFTPRAKKVLELALRESLQLGHNYIGTEHLLLGLLREGEGVAAQVLVKLGADLETVRKQVVELVASYTGSEEAIQDPFPPKKVSSWKRIPDEVRIPEPDEVRIPEEAPAPLCPTCGSELADSIAIKKLDIEIEDEVEGESRSVQVFYCTICGRALGATGT
jgi:ATP-dependent Clp protease ATP-binding subunit ClpA